MKIYKYLLNVTDHQVIKLPYVWQILTIQKQFDFFVMWALVDTNTKETEMEIEMYGTGEEVREKANKMYIATVQDGNLVWHFFRVMQ